MSNTELHLVEEKVAEQSKDFSPHIGEDIGYEKGAKMIKNYCDKNHNEMSAHFIGRNMIEAILDQPGVVGITMFAGLDKSGASQPVLVGVNSKGDYVLNITTVTEDGDLFKQKGIITAGVREPGNNPPPKEDSWIW